MDSKRIGLKIKHLRHSAGMTQKELAERIGTTWEMVSRYETGKSSALQKLPLIADALDVNMATLISETSLEEPAIGYNRNTIPLIEKPFTSLKEALSSTKSYYAAPDWIVHTCMKPFAVNTDIVELETSKVKGNGILYITSEKPASSGELILAQSDNTLKLLANGMQSSRDKVLGTVVAWEQRLR